MDENRDPRALLEHAAWLRRLAHALAGEASEAEDLVQDTWVRALAHPPREAGRGWLATVLRRRHADRLRSEVSRRERERRVALERTGAEEPDAAESLERVAAQRAVIEELLDLEEPYRATLSLRFVDGLSYRAIARRTNVEPATVNSRVTRGLRLLRERLERRWAREGRGAGEGLCGLLLLAHHRPPLSLLPSASWSTSSSALLMHVSAKTVLLVGLPLAVLATLSVLGWWDVESPRDPAEPTNERLEALAAELEGLEPTAGHTPTLRTERERAAVPESADVVAAPVPAGAAARRVHGIVLDTAGRGVGGVDLVTLPREENAARATSAAGGHFEIEVHDGARSIVAAGTGHVTVLGAAITSDEGSEAVLVVAPPIALAGRVTDELGAPLEGARVAFVASDAWSPRLERVLDHSLPRTWTSESDREGRFRIEDAPALPGARLLAHHPGHRSADLEAPIRSDPALEIALPRVPPQGGELRGVVVAPSGRTVEGAWVSDGRRTTTTDARGEFALASAPDSSPARLTALARGRQPARLDLAPGAAWPPWVVLELGPAPLSLAGVVRDADGAPLPGARVWLADGTTFGPVDGDLLQVEALLGREDRAVWPKVDADAHGRFRFEGLYARPYDVSAIHPHTLAIHTTPNVEAGRDGVEVVFPEHELVEVAGRVTTVSGEPLEGIRVRAYVDAFEVRFGTSVYNDGLESRDDLTDAEGRFRLGLLDPRVSMLHAAGDGILNTGVRSAEIPDLGDVTLLVRRRHHLQVELDPPVDRADGVQVLDAEGRPIDLRVVRGEGHDRSTWMPLHDGRSEMLSISDEAAEVVILAGEEVVGRRAVRLLPGEPLRVRF